VPDARNLRLIRSLTSRRQVFPMIGLPGWRFLDGWRSRAAALLARNRFAASALDQAALSLFNFGMSLCLVRALSATDFGIVSLWMTVSLLAIGIQSALVNGPLSIYLPGAADEDAARRLETALATVNSATLIATGVGVWLALTIGDAEWAPSDTLTTIAVIAYVVTSLYREYHRSVAFSRQDMGMLLRVDIPYLVGTTACLVVMLAWPQHFGSLAVAFFVLSLGAIASRLCLWRQLRGHRPRPLTRGVLLPYRRVAHEIGWSVVGVTTTHLAGRSYVYVTIEMVGLAALAAINVVGVLMRPVRTLITAWGRTALPQLAGHFAARRIDAFDRMIMHAFIGAGAVSLAWSILVCLAWGPIEHHFLAGKYPDAWLLVLPWAVTVALQCLEYTVNIALQSAREFKFLAYTTLLTAPLTVAATIGAIHWHGYTWTIYGTAFGSVVALGMEASRLYIVRRRVIGAEPASPNAAQAG
jgi:O-antigen/teichoic acid export membrane protein